MNYTEISKIISSIKMPGYNIACVLQNTMGGIVICVDFKAEDNFRPGEVFWGQSAAMISPDSLHSEKDVINLVHRIIVKQAEHEVGEKFQVDGKLPFNPHNVPVAKNTNNRSYF